jgi:hypothetical protein
MDSVMLFFIRASMDVVHSSFRGLCCTVFMCYDLPSYEIANSTIPKTNSLSSENAVLSQVLYVIAPNSLQDRQYTLLCHFTGRETEHRLESHSCMVTHLGNGRPRIYIEKFMLSPL